MVVRCTILIKCTKSKQRATFLSAIKIISWTTFGSSLELDRQETIDQDKFVSGFGNPEAISDYTEI